MRTVSLAFMLAFTIPAALLPAQDMKASVGDSIRVTPVCDRDIDLQTGESIRSCLAYGGRVTALSSDSLVLSVGARGRRLAAPLSDVEKLEVHRFEGYRGTLRGAVQGAAILGSLGLVATIIMLRDCNPGFDLFCEIDTGGELFLIGGGTGIGFILGGFMGSLLSSGERWEPVPLGPVVADVAVGRDGQVGLVASVPFR